MHLPANMATASIGRYNRAYDIAGTSLSQLLKLFSDD